MTALLTTATAERIEAGQLAGIVQCGSIHPAYIDCISVRGRIFARFLTPDGTGWDKATPVELDNVNHLVTPAQARREWRDLPRLPA